MGQGIAIGIIGFLGGVVSGLFGVGGGVIFVPLMVLLLGVDFHLAIGTSLAVIVPTALAGMGGHLLSGRVDWKLFFWLTLFSVFGAWLGAGLSVKLEVTLLRKLYALFLMALAVRLFFKP